VFIFGHALYGVASFVYCVKYYVYSMLLKYSMNEVITVYLVHVLSVTVMVQTKTSGKVKI